MWTKSLIFVFLSKNVYQNRQLSLFGAYLVESMVFVVKRRLGDMVAIVPVLVDQFAVICNRCCQLLFCDSEAHRIMELAISKFKDPLAGPILYW